MSEKTFASAIFMVIFLAALTAFGPFVTDFYLPAMPAQAKDLNAFGGFDPSWSFSLYVGACNRSTYCGAIIGS